MTTKNRKTITRLPAMQIDAHVDGNTKHSDKILALYEMKYMLGEMILSVQNTIPLIK